MERVRVVGKSPTRFVILPNMSSVTATAPAHAHEITERVGWEDVDLVAIVRYSAYARFADAVEAEMFRRVGLGHPAMLDAYGVWLVRRVLHLEFHAPARFDEVLRVRGWIGRVGRTSVTLHVEVRDESRATLHAAGHLVLVAVEAAGMTAVEVPAGVVAALAPYREPGTG
jgi:YbgC/YbaW family acyl-CoA thioester hydrolase